MLKIFSVALKHLGTIRKVSDTLSILVEHSEQVVPKVKAIWTNEQK